MHAVRNSSRFPRKITRNAGPLTTKVYILCRRTLEVLWGDVQCGTPLSYGRFPVCVVGCMAVSPFFRFFFFFCGGARMSILRARF
jgi:hypothetical protein